MEKFLFVVLIEMERVLGFDFNLVKLISRYSNVPIIICSGAGSKEDVLNLVKNSNCDGVGIGSMFHYNYIKKVESKYMSYNSNKLRMGKEIRILGILNLSKKITLIYII